MTLFVVIWLTISASTYQIKDCDIPDTNVAIREHDQRLITLDVYRTREAAQHLIDTATPEQQSHMQIIELK